MPEQNGKPALTFQQKIQKAKKAVTDAGFMVHPRYQPKGDGVQVYALIPIPVLDLNKGDTELADQVRDWIRMRCDKVQRVPVSTPQGTTDTKPPDLRTIAGRKWKESQAGATT